MGRFVDKVRSLSSRKESHLVLALDVSKGNGIRTLKGAAQTLGEYLVGIKLGIPFVLSTPLDLLKPVMSDYEEDFAFIVDAKLADVSHVNAMISDMLFGAGFDAIISHGFIGYEGGLDGAVEVARRLDGGILVLVSMSHKASDRMIDRFLPEIVREALLAEPDGLIAPATRPDVIRKVRAMVPEGMLILSPGVGAQGAPVGSALRAGADLEIVGRGIYASPDPLAAARAAVEEQKRVMGA